MPDTKIQPAKDDLDHPEEVTFENAPQLEVEGTVEYKEPKTAETFSQRAENINEIIRKTTEDGGSQQQGYSRASKKYLTESKKNNQLELFTGMLLSAPIAYENEKKLKKIKVELKSDPYNQKLRDEKKQLSTVVEKFNHLARGLILNNNGEFTRKELENWLGRFSGNNFPWAEQLISGIAAEVAFLKLLKNKASGKTIFSTIEEDIRGVDIFFTTPNSNDIINIDIKYGNNRPLERVEKKRHRDGSIAEYKGRPIIEIGLEKNAINEFDIASDYEGEMLEALEDAISMG